MNRENVYNFAAGPSAMPEEVLSRAGREILNYNGTGMSVMEMSHRGSDFGEILASAKSRLKELMGIPGSHEILFLQGGASLQFAAIPMNLMDGGVADYAITGNFSKKAAKEAEKYGRVNIACSSADTGFDRIPAQNELNLTQGAKYFYYCANNTVYGTEWQYVPETNAPLVCDMSSDILSRSVDVSRYGLIYAGAQKNMSAAGLTVVIVDKSLCGREMSITPQIMSFKEEVENDSLINTPPCWCIYMLGLMLEWVQAQGGVPTMEQARMEKAGRLYEYLDNSRLFIPHAKPGSRSYMNVTFSTGSKELDEKFIRESTKAGLLNLKGHKVAGGMRASLYNAMPKAGADRLIEFMKKFEVENNV